MKIQRYDESDIDFPEETMEFNNEGFWMWYSDHEAKMKQAMRIIRKQKKEIDGLRFFKQVSNMPIEEVNKLLSRYDE